MKNDEFYQISSNY